MSPYQYPRTTDAAHYPLLGNPHRHYYPTRRGPLLGIVVHVTAGLQDLDGVADQSAERTNLYGATTATQASWHVAVDSDSIAPALPAGVVAFHASGYNTHTFGVEISNSDARWDNKPPAWVTATLRNAARAAAPVVVAFALPIVRATRTQVDAAIVAGRPFGLTDHARLNPLTRTDPGATFPWDRFLAMVREEVAALTHTPPPPMKGTPMTPEQAALLSYISAQLKTIGAQLNYTRSQVKAVAGLVTTGDATTRAQLTAELDDLDAKLDALAAAQVTP